MVSRTPVNCSSIATSFSTSTSIVKRRTLQRREFLGHLGSGLSGIALASLMHRETIGAIPPPIPSEGEARHSAFHEWRREPMRPIRLQAATHRAARPKIRPRSGCAR